MEQRILVNVKKVLGLVEADTSFDEDIIMHINTAFNRLNQLGIGPADGYAIEDNTATWDAFIGAGSKRHMIKSFVFASVRLIFDPPTTSYALASMEKQIDKFEWLLNVEREDDEWQAPALSS